MTVASAASVLDSAAAPGAGVEEAQWAVVDVEDGAMVQVTEG